MEKMESRFRHRSPRTHRFRSFLFVAVAVVSLVVALFVLGTLHSSGEPALIGTELDGRTAADFILTDYRGQTVSLGGLRGKVIVLTFIYTHCPDVCPITARNLQTAYAQLSVADHERVALVAVTVDPARDTPEALRAFSERHGLDENPNWYALRGDSDALAPVWQAYGVYPGTSAAIPAHAHTTESPASAGGGQGHTDALYLIDPDGRRRVLMRSYIEPSSLVHNIDALLD